MTVFDFGEYSLSGVYYGGSERKLGISIYGDRYMLKFQKNTPFGKRNNHLSEYIGSHIFELLGLNVHKTFLGILQEHQVVACRDFVCDGFLFVPFNDIGESSIDVDRDKYQYSYDDIVLLLESNKKITNVEETTATFFDMYIVDALLGNFDRHGGNWGFLKKNNIYYMAPIFDNGSCLFPQMIDEFEMNRIIHDEEEINRRVYQFPTSQIQLNGKKSSYYDVIFSLKYPLCNDALIRIYKRIKLDKINELIDSLPISKIHKCFYKTMIQARYEKIIKESYDKLMVIKNEEYGE